MWKFFKNLAKQLFGKKKRSVKFIYKDRKVKAVSIGKNVTMKIEKPINMPDLTSDELEEILIEVARRLEQWV